MSNDTLSSMLPADVVMLDITELAQVHGSLDRVDAALGLPHGTCASVVQSGCVCPDTAERLVSMVPSAPVRALIRRAERDRQASRFGGGVGTYPWLDSYQRRWKVTRRTAERHWRVVRKNEVIPSWLADQWCLALGTQLEIVYRQEELRKREPSPRAEVDEDKALRLIAQGHSIRNAARLCGASEATLRRRLKQHYAYRPGAANPLFWQRVQRVAAEPLDPYALTPQERTTYYNEEWKDHR